MSARRSSAANSNGFTVNPRGNGATPINCLLAWPRPEYRRNYPQIACFAAKLFPDHRLRARAALGMLSGKNGAG